MISKTDNTTVASLRSGTFELTFSLHKQKTEGNFYNCIRSLFPGANLTTIRLFRPYTNRRNQQVTITNDPKTNIVDYLCYLHLHQINKTCFV